MSDEKPSVKKVPYDPGWNDPPLFSYDASRQLAEQSSQQGKPYTLTKRVAHSIEQSPPVTKLPPHPSASVLPASAPPRSSVLPASAPRSSVLPLSAPPPPGVPLSSAPPLSCAVSSPSKSSPHPQFDTNHSDNLKVNESDQVVELSAVLRNFSQVIEDIYDKSDEKEPKEINRRLSLMESMWTEGKFPVAVQQKLLEISEGLKSEDIEKCDSLQRGLMVDHSSVCSSWMPAVRILINSKRTKNSL